MDSYPPPQGNQTEISPMLYGKIEVESRTIQENIDQRIEYLRSEIKRLETLRYQLVVTGLLPIRISDLRRAMQL